MRDVRDLLDRFCDPWRLPGRRSWFLVSAHGRGDTYLIAALLNAFRAAHGAVTDDIVLVVKASHKSIAEMFARDASRIVAVEDATLTRVSDIAAGAGLRTDLATDRAMFVHPTTMGDGRIDTVTAFEGFSQKSMYQYLLRLPFDSRLARPEIRPDWRRDAALFAARHGIAPGRSVLLFPDANSYPLVPDPFWNGLSRALAAQGWSVFTNAYGTNVGGKRAPFDGSRPIEPPLEILVPLAEMAGWAISTLTGAMNILISAEANCAKTVVARAPDPAEAGSFIAAFPLRSAFPYASQKTFDGAHYDIEEIEVRAGGDYGPVIDQILGGVNARGAPPSPRAMVQLIADTSPGDVLDRLTILEIKAERLDDPLARHSIYKEQLLLRARLDAMIGPLSQAVLDKVAELKAANVEGWDMNEIFFKDFDEDDFGTEQWRIDLADPASVARAERMIRVYRRSQAMNRRRVAIKNEINGLLAYSIHEQKSY